jgi:hypothetical protein
MGSGGLSFMRPVCVECLELNGCCLANLPKTAFWREGDSQMVCCLSGSVQLHVSTNGHVCEYTIPAGSFGYYHGHCGGRYDTYATESEARVLQIHFPGKALAAMLGDAWLPPRSTCPRKDGTFAGMVREITPPMNRIITSIKEALRRKAGNDLYLLAKSLELLSLLKDSEAEVFGARMDSRDRRAIQEAVDIMTRRLDTPLSQGLRGHALRVSAPDAHGAGHESAASG